MNCLFAFCFKDSTDPASSKVLEKPLTTSSIILLADDLEEAVLENVLEPGVNRVVKKITGQDISGVIDTFVKKDVEPVVEKVMKPEIEMGIKAVKQSPIVIPVVKSAGDKAPKDQTHVLQRNESTIIKKG
jgi:hypothetical protein